MVVVNNTQKLNKNLCYHYTVHVLERTILLSVYYLSHIYLTYTSLSV